MLWPCPVSLQLSSAGEAQQSCYHLLPRADQSWFPLEKELWSPLFLQTSGQAPSQQHSTQHRGAVSPRACSGWHHLPAAPLLLPLPGCIGAQQMQELQFSRGWVLEALAPPPGSLLRLWCLSLTSGHQCSWWGRRGGHPTHALENLGRTMLGHQILQFSLSLLGLKLSAWMVQGLF